MLQVGLPAARDDKRTTASGAINPMVPGPGPITIVSLSPCDAHAGDEAQASDVQVRHIPIARLWQAVYMRSVQRHDMIMYMTC
jgi:hypothetical protein